MSVYSARISAEFEFTGSLGGKHNSSVSVTRIYIPTNKNKIKILPVDGGFKMHLTVMIPSIKHDIYNKKKKMYKSLAEAYCMEDRGKLSQGLCISNYTVLSQQFSYKISFSSNFKCWFQIPLIVKL